MVEFISCSRMNHHIPTNQIGNCLVFRITREMLDINLTANPSMIGKVGSALPVDGQTSRLTTIMVKRITLQDIEGMNARDDIALVLDEPIGQPPFKLRLRANQIGREFARTPAFVAASGAVCNFLAGLSRPGCQGCQGRFIIFTICLVNGRSERGTRKQYLGQPQNKHKYA